LTWEARHGPSKGKATLALDSAPGFPVLSSFRTAVRWRPPTGCKAPHRPWWAIHYRNPGRHDPDPRAGPGVARGPLVGTRV